MSNARSDARSGVFVSARSRVFAARSSARTGAFVSARSNVRSAGSRSAPGSSGSSGSRERAAQLAVKELIKKELQRRYVCDDEDKQSTCLLRIDLQLFIL